MHIKGCISPSILISFLLVSSIAIFVPVSKVNASPGMLTGRIFDEAIDKDGNGLFDYLQVKVEVNITSGDSYTTSISGLNNITQEPYSYVSVYDSILLNLDAGVQNVTLSFYGPTIRASGQTNLDSVSYVSISSRGYYYDSKQNVSLSRPYSYLEFDAAFTDMEASFQVFPNGTVGMAGMLNSSRLTYPAKGLNVSASVDASTGDNRTTVSASENLTLPKWVTSQWPFNASTISALAQYSKQTGLLNLGLNGTLVLSPDYPALYYPNFGSYPYQYFYGSQYPWNTSDFTLNLAYSNGIANGELDASTILPTSATSAFPFNATDFTLNADYSEGLLNGNITFHILPSFPAGDLNLGFVATRTQTTATGAITVIYGTYPSYPNPLIVDEAYVDMIIGNITILEGTGPDSLYNITQGLMELSPASSIIKTPLNDSAGVTVDFDIILHGDLIAYIAYMLSSPNTNNITYPGVYHLLNVTATSVNSASLHLSYQHGPQTAILGLTFVDNFEQLLTDLFTFPPDTTPYAVASYSMRPTLDIGDVVLVRNITDVSEINAAPYPNGDIIAFYSPNDLRNVIVHRAIDSTFWNDTWYFQTKGDYNYGSDFWNGNDTYMGMISEKLVFGKVVERIPWMGNLFLQQYIYAFGPNPQIQFKDIPTLIEDFLSSVKAFNLHLTYASATQTFDLKSDFAFDILGYRDKTIPRLPDLVDLSMKTFVKDLFANTYAEITSGEVQFTYQDGQEKLQATLEIQGDPSREINYIKTLYMNEIAEQAPFVPPEPFLFINATLLDINDLKLTCTIVEESAFFSFEGFRASPPTDPINETSFNLYRFFNLTAPTASYVIESPRSGEKLKLTVQGMNNDTHILTLSRPSTIPAPDYVSDDQTLMSWNNLSISTLKNLVFSLQYYTGFTYNGQTYSVITNSNGSVSPVTFDQPRKQISLTINGPEGTQGYANISVPKDLINAPYDQWVIVIGSRTIVYPDYQVNETATNTFLYFTFNFSSQVTVQITGTEALSEFPTLQILPMLILTTLIIAAGGKIVMKIRRRPDKTEDSNHST